MSKKTLGAVLKEIRDGHGWSLRQAEDATGIDHAHIGRIEKGEREPSLTVLMRIAEGYGVSLGQILGDAGII